MGTIFTSVDVETDPKPFADDDFTKTSDPMGWWNLVMELARVMGLKEKAVVSNSEGRIPFVRIFRPSNIITKETRYGWLDWLLFKFHGVFDPWLPTNFHSVNTELLGRAMVQDAVNVLSGRTTTADYGAGGDGAARFTYGEFVHIAGEDAGAKNAEL